MTNWRHLLKNSITRPDQLAALLPVDPDPIEKTIQRYPMRINSYYLSLIQEMGDPIWKQAVPDSRELEDREGMVDPLGEEKLSPVPGLVHKYPDRALLLVCSECAMYCRFCTRKRKVGRPEMVITDATIRAGLEYLQKTPAIREVLISGGDPLLLSTARLEEILCSLRAIPSIEVIRIGTRVPCTLPMRVTENLVSMLKKYHPLYINTHFNHPAELTPEARQACSLLADGGIPLGCQTVLLKGVNDDPETIRELMVGLLAMRVKPYYLFQADLTRGTGHFRTSISCGLNIMRSLIGHVSGMAVPTYALDAPGGGGKIPLTPSYNVIGKGETDFTSYLGQVFQYPGEKG
ncbi:KamA family radical SAM protein [Desulfolithobacter dissulfuricans]|nr:KamA family radical SAM protein [Desulfolithobacter dissulfuricans]